MPCPLSLTLRLPHRLQNIHSLFLLLLRSFEIVNFQISNCIFSANATCHHGRYVAAVTSDSHTVILATAAPFVVCFNCFAVSS